MSAPKTTLSLIEDLVAYRDRVTDRADRAMLADVANELSRLNARNQGEGQGWRSVKEMPADTYGLVWGPKIAWRSPSIGYRHSDYNGHKDVVTLDGRAGHPSRDVTMWAPILTPPASPAVIAKAVLA